MPIFTISVILLFTAFALFPPVAGATIDIFTNFFHYNPGASTVFYSPGQLISRLLPNVLILAGVICFLVIILGGFQLILYGGQYNAPAKVSQAKNLVTYGLIGFLLVVSAFFILQIISTITGINFVNVNVF